MPTAIERQFNKSTNILTPSIGYCLTSTEPTLLKVSYKTKVDMLTDNRHWLLDWHLRDHVNQKVIEFIDSLKYMTTLRDNWNGYGSERPNGLAREAAEAVLLATPSVRIPDRIAASAQGGIGIFFYNREKYADIECFNNGEILGTTVTGNGEPDIWPFTSSEIKGALEKIGTFLGL